MKLDKQNQIPTPYGQLIQKGDGYMIVARHDQLTTWANRSGSVWPCSELARLSSAWVEYDAHGDLIDLAEQIQDMPGDELAAWETDVVNAAGGGNCGCCGRRNTKR